MSNFGTATLDLLEKVGFRPLFQELVPKPTGFWNKLTLLDIDVVPLEVGNSPAGFWGTAALGVFIDKAPVILQ